MFVRCCSFHSICGRIWNVIRLTYWHAHKITSYFENEFNIEILNGYSIFSSPFCLEIIDFIHHRETSWLLHMDAIRRSMDRLNLSSYFVISVHTAQRCPNLFVDTASAYSYHYYYYHIICTKIIFASNGRKRYRRLEAEDTEETRMSDNETIDLFILLFVFRYLPNNKGNRFASMTYSYIITRSQTLTLIDQVGI